MIDRSRLLSHLTDQDERLVGARVVDAATACLDDDQPVATDFLDPFARRVASGVLGSMEAVSFRGYGGYAQAERQRILVYPTNFLEDLLEPPVCAAQVSGVPESDALSHRDYLGAILATGLKRERVGDVLLTPGGCQMVLAPEALGFLLTNLHRVQGVAVQVTEIDPDQLAVAPARVKEIRTTVASMRLDAVAAFGFGMSRTRMVREIKAERLKLNWRSVSDPAESVQEGDVISMRGRGRLAVEQVGGATRKGRLSLLLKRYF